MKLCGLLNYVLECSRLVLVITDLREAKVDCVTLGQYMQPTRLHLKVIAKAIAAISSFQSPFLCGAQFPSFFRIRSLFVVVFIVPIV